MTQKGSLSPEDEQRLQEAKAAYFETLDVRDAYKALAVELLDRASFREVGRVAGVSTNTLQRWKREASEPPPAIICMKCGADVEKQGYLCCPG